MTSKCPVRSCEDVDEATLTYAEVKALATGNPYIKEKMDLDIQVTKLKLLKASHSSQMYRLQDDIANTYPVKIQKLNEIIAGLKADLKTYKENISDEFIMKVGEKEFTEKKEAGEALLKECNKKNGIDMEISVGSYKGFRLKVKYDYFERAYILNLKGKINHYVELGHSDIGNITKINNTLENIQVKLDERINELEIAKNNLEKAKIEVNTPFPKEQELSEKTARLVELNLLLDMDNNVENAEEIYENENINDEEKMTDTDSFLDKIHSYSKNDKSSKEDINNLANDNEIEI